MAVIELSLRLMVGGFYVTFGNRNVFSFDSCGSFASTGSRLIRPKGKHVRFLVKAGKFLVNDWEPPTTCRCFCEIW